MVTVNYNFDDVTSWIEVQKTRFSVEELQCFINAIEIITPFYIKNNFYPTNIDLLLYILYCADNVAQLNLYADAVIATLCIFLPRYTKSWKTILTVFGPSVIHLIDGVNKIDKARLLSSLDGTPIIQQETVRNMLLALVSDIRVVIIVLVVRGKLLLYLDLSIDNNLIQQISIETAEIFAPLANRLGLYNIKWELEDLSFKYLHYDDYKLIVNLLNETRDSRIQYIANLQKQLSLKINEIGILAYQVSGRAKHIYSIWHKICHKNYEFADLPDINAIRILVPEIDDCYKVLSIINEYFQPIENDFEDYIMSPKANNYQSLHSCVFDSEGKKIEIQIRTFLMHEHAEYGIAAHWKYKEMHNKTVNNNAFADKIAWLRQMLDWRDEILDKRDAGIFKSDFLDDTIYVITPNGRVIDLPKGSTTIDFAYYVHSSIGHRCRGARINGKLVPLSTVLDSGQVVEIILSKSGGPSLNWLHDKWVNTNRAIRSIKKYFRIQDNEYFFITGKTIFEKEYAKILPALRPSIIDLCSSLNYRNQKELFIMLGKGDLSIQQLNKDLKCLVNKDDQPTQTNININNQYLLAKNSDAIVAGGVSGLLTYFAKCCKPIASDELKGFITRGKGIAIHRSGCKTLIRNANLYPNRMIDISINSAVTCVIDIKVVLVNNNPDSLQQLTELFSREKLKCVKVSQLNLNKHHYIFSLLVKDIDFVIESVLNKILVIDGVLSAVRK